MKNIIIIENFDDNDNSGLLIESNEMEEQISFGDMQVLIIDYPVEKVGDLETMYKNEMINHIEVHDEIEIFLEERNITYKFTSEYENFEETKILFNKNPDQFQFTLSTEWETVMTYSYWDGSNHKTIEIDSYSEYTLYDDYINIDELYEHNLNTGGIGNHVNIYSTVDDEILWNEQSEWQGVQQTGEIISPDEFENRLKEYDRNVDYYLNEFSKIGIEVQIEN